MFSGVWKWLRIGKSSCSPLRPRAVERPTAKCLPAVETKFFTHRQFFCCNWDVPKLRVPLAWIFYARHVLRHVRSGDLVVMDNYEFLYVVAARLVRIFRRVTFVLIYLDRETSD